MEDKLNMTMDWDKTFPKSGRVEHGKVCFHNRYGISLAADIYRPRGGRGPAARPGGLRPLRGGEGAVLRALRPDHGGAGLSHLGL